jgi:hypothetical protein
VHPVPLASQPDPDLERNFMRDRNMLTVTGGRERWEREWRTPLEAADSRLAGVYPVGSDIGIIEAKLPRDMTAPIMRLPIDSLIF